MKVLLIGNYPPDRQRSMQGFAALLARTLPMAGMRPTLLAPQPRLNRAGTAAGLGKWLGYLDKFVVFPRRLRVKLREMDPDVVHVCDHSNSMYLRMAGKRPRSITCHDLMAVRSALGEIRENPTRASGRLLQKWILGGLRTAPAVACVSQATRTDLLRLTGLAAEKCPVIHSSPPRACTPIPWSQAQGELGKLGVRPPYLLHVGGNQWYKNRPGVLRIHDELTRLVPEAPSLIMAGEAPDAALRSLAATLRSRVIWAVDPTDEQVAALYSHADLLLFPSLCEGFGWPVIEAMSRGCRVVTSGLGSMLEAGGDAAYFVDPTNIAESARVVADALRDPEAASRAEQGRGHVARFSEEAMVEGYHRLFAGLVLPRPASPVVPA